MERIPRNTTDKPIKMEVIGITVPAKSRYSRPLSFDELHRVNTCGVNYEGIVLEPVVMEAAGSSGPAKQEAAGPQGLVTDESVASSRRGRRKFEAE